MAFTLQNSNTGGFQLRFQLVFSHVASSSPFVCGSPSPNRVVTITKYKDQLFFPSGEQKRERLIVRMFSDGEPSTNKKYLTLGTFIPTGCIYCYSERTYFVKF